ncbi:TPA: HD domain-containing protein [Candidatus Poribacteria bacterium]|nr:HD domain-containing protein [Candidatus Poribacteria bacterium]
MRNPDFDHKLEQAITFLVATFQQSGNNPKPVILHSIRVALYLYDQDYPDETVIAAVLHDLVEDSDCTIPEIEQDFGKEVAQLVAANTFDATIEDKTERNRKMFSRCKAHGKMALLIKAVDILDNSRYWHLLTDKELSRWLLWKIRYFLELSALELEREQVWQNLSQRYQQLVASIG